MELVLGKKYRRTELHDAFGGSRQSGIAHCRREPVILLFSNPAKGRHHGYHDGWGPDGIFYYCGEGQIGPQQLSSQGNKALLHHQKDQRAVHLFLASPDSLHVYHGQFSLASDVPYRFTEAPETNGGPLRTVITFRLEPVSDVLAGGPVLPHAPTATPEQEATVTVEDIEIEAHKTKTILISPSAEPRSFSRIESALVQEYCRHMESTGHRLTRKRITQPGESSSLYSDIFNSTENLLIEAKGSITREAIRMGIGQLLDYRRFIDPRPELALLVPGKPRPDLLSLCADLAISVIWPHETGYQHATANQSGTNNS
ncbi:restriction endonuclease [Kitasatospora sp. NBC_01287]|uniref:restriction endonuclease n=1 Tax=Kitasatospora sp. NBC_01287 TaxID=2903573 RepID=UPI002250AB29|nr:restriction endonuclease [Kitasatospora sp. NBC_01287]MCX4747474.1 restriction endonuclease [Kitasatospora sp. NBC_01287]